MKLRISNLIYWKLLCLQWVNPLFHNTVFFYSVHEADLFIMIPKIVRLITINNVVFSFIIFAMPQKLNYTGK